MRTERLERFLPHLRGTSRAGVPGDLLAGVAVAALAVPQGMAFALVAGVPPAMGLWAAAIPAIAAALFGSSRFLVTGPTNPIALIVGASIVAPALASGGPVPIGSVLAATLLAVTVVMVEALLPGPGGGLWRNDLLDARTHSGLFVRDRDNAARLDIFSIQQALLALAENTTGVAAISRATGSAYPLAL